MYQRCLQFIRQHITHILQNKLQVEVVEDIIYQRSSTRYTYTVYILYSTYIVTCILYLALCYDVLFHFVIQSVG